MEKKHIIMDKEITVLHLPSLSSTNTLLKEEEKKGAPDGLTVIADRQSGGRGRLGRSFYSEEGGLYMSFLLRELPLSDVTSVTAAAGVSVCEAIEELYGRNCHIKWVNDVQIDGKKVCGILAEGAVGTSGRVESVIVGVGVNIKAPSGGFPDEIKDIACAIGDAYSPEARDGLAYKLLERFYQNIASSELHSKYLSRLSVIGKAITVHTPLESYKAIALGIDDSFGLVICKENGERDVIKSGEISIREI